MSQRAAFAGNGLHRLLSSPEFRRKRAAIEAEVRAERAAELCGSISFWKRRALQQEISREVDRRLGLPSQQALFVSR